MGASLLVSAIQATAATRQTDATTKTAKATAGYPEQSPGQAGEAVGRGIGPPYGMRISVTRQIPHRAHEWR
jgi:hypothetical protein